MPLRKRISLAAAFAVATAVALALLASYLVVRNQLIGQIDGELTDQAAAILNGNTRSLTQPLAGLPASAGGPAPYRQIVAQSGEVVAIGGVRLPGIRQAQAVASGTARAFLTDVTVGRATLRVYTFQYVVPFAGSTAVAIQLARPLNSVENVLAHLKLILSLIFLAGVAFAALLGRMAARRVLAPLSQVTATAQVIGETDDLSRRIDVHTDDEVGQLAERFNTMLERLAASRAELDESVRAQRQLVADASHELRTPVTSLRTNIEILLGGGELDPEDRQALLCDVVEQTEELTTLVSDLIEVARGELPAESLEDLRLDLVVEESLARARRNAPEVEFRESLTPVLVQGDAGRLTRAINNLLENAVKHAGAGPVEVTVDLTGVTVRDHGPGIAEHDLPHVFDRFYRGANSRAVQGSGLGLAIVRQVAELHGGTVQASNAPGGGAVFTLRLPTVPAEADSYEGYRATRV